MRKVKVMALVACVILIAGCGRSVTQAQASSPATLRMSVLAGLYSQFATSSNGGLPTDEKRLKEFMKTPDGKAYLAKQGSAADDLFVSLRDGQPLVLTYSISSTASSASTNRIVAYEKTGLNGKRLVALLSGTVVEVDQETFDKLRANSGNVH